MWETYFNVKMYVYREICVFKWQLLLSSTVLMSVLYGDVMLPSS